ncbi:MAG: hypothetical protein ACLTW9_01630 [Enterocloster sp.]
MRQSKGIQPKDSGLVVRLFDRVQEYMVTNMAKDQYLKVAMDASRKRETE